MRAILLFLVLLVVLVVAYLLLPVERMQSQAKGTIEQAQSFRTSLDFGDVVDGLGSFFKEQEYVLPGEGEPSGDTYTFCTDEAMVCPDGSVVGRTGPDCAFAPCPGEGEPSGDTYTFCTDEAMVCPDGSVVGRTGPDCAFAPCPGEGEQVEIPIENGGSAVLVR